MQIKYIKRIWYIPLGVLKGVIKFINNNARDLENKSRFKDAIIDSDCSFSSNVKIGEYCHILSGCVVNNSRVSKYTYISKNTTIQNATIGSYCSISHNVIIGVGKHPLDLFSTSPLFYKRDNILNLKLIDKDSNFEEYKVITIGSDVWIGTRAVLLDGINVGHGAVIAAGAVVTKDIPPYAIVGGVPAKVIKYRFSEEIRNYLLKSNWWEKNAETVQSNNILLATICQGDFSKTSIIDF